MGTHAAMESVLVVVLSLACTASCRPQGYILPSPASGAVEVKAPPIFVVDSVPEDIQCGRDEIRNTDGSCAVAEVTRSVFLFTPSAPVPAPLPPPFVPKPKINTNVVFVRVPEAAKPPEPIVIPPPRQDNIIYVLSQVVNHEQKVIEIPAPPPQSEVIFVSYDEGQDITLPNGQDLHSTLLEAQEGTAQLIRGHDPGHHTNDV